MKEGGGKLKGTEGATIAKGETGGGIKKEGGHGLKKSC